MPRKSRRKNRWRLRWLGLAFIVILLPVLLAAWNTGTNLLYIIVGGLTSLIVLSTFLSDWTARRVTLERTAPDTVHRLSPFWVMVRLENRKWVLPIYSLRLNVLGKIRTLGGYLAALPARRAAVIHVKLEMNRRGVHRIPDFEIATRFPFGLSERVIRFQDDLEVVVYPRVHMLRSTSLEQLSTGRESTVMNNGEGDEFFSLREYVPGDDVRRISWRVSARVGKWVVRELARERARSVVFVLDTLDPGDLPEYEDRFEEAVELAASLAISMLRQRYSVGIITPSTHLEQGEGTAHERQVLEMLARVNPSRSQHGFDELVRSLEMQRMLVVYISADPRRWGTRHAPGSFRILDPREVVHA
jgi:uncharacterized protein (DUF58 family)